MTGQNCRQKWRCFSEYFLGKFRRFFVEICISSQKTPLYQRLSVATGLRRVIQKNATISNNNFVTILTHLMLNFIHEETPRHIIYTGTLFARVYIFYEYLGNDHYQSVWKYVNDFNLHPTLTKNQFKNLIPIRNANRWRKCRFCIFWYPTEAANPFKNIREKKINKNKTWSLYKENPEEILFL